MKWLGLLLVGVVGVILGEFLGFGLLGVVWNGAAFLLKFLVYDLAPLWFVLLFLFVLSQRHALQSNYRGLF